MIEPFGNVLDQTVADRMAQAVVDGLETVKVEQQYCEVYLAVLTAALQQIF